jgi:hypothetical protein
MKIIKETLYHGLMYVLFIYMLYNPKDTVCIWHFSLLKVNKTVIVIEAAHRSVFYIGLISYVDGDDSHPF